MIHGVELFKDFSPKGMYKTYSIEMEISQKFRSELSTKFPKLKHITETDYIHELVDMHNNEDKEEICNAVRDYYKDKFPVGSDGCLSGGTHFHIHMKPEVAKWLEHRLKEPDKFKLLRKVIVNVPLYLKINNGKLYGRNRGSQYDSSYIGWNEKSNFITLKDSFLSTRRGGGHNPTSFNTIECRINNVVDHRLYGYWLGCLLLTINPDYASRLKLDSNKFVLSQSHYDKRALSDVTLNFEEMHSPENIAISNDHIHNINVLLSLLNDSGYTKAAKALKEYIIENNVSL